MDIEMILSRDNPVFAAYAFYAAILTFKVIFVALLTSKTRMSKHIYANPEDAATVKGGKVTMSDPDVDRVRRAHLNDLENIPFFLVVAFLYVLISPSPWLAVNLIRLYTFARCMHTFVYAVVPTPQPARAIAFALGLAVTVYMAGSVIFYMM